MKSETIGFAVLAFTATVSAVAADLTLVGNSAANWNTSTQCWTNSVGASVAFQTGDNVLISSDYFTGTTLYMNELLNPKDVVIDIDRTLNLKIKSSNTNGLGPKIESFKKYGSGTLLLSTESAYTGSNATLSYGNALTCGVEIVEGEIACAATANHHHYLGPRDYPFWVHVHKGAALSFLERNQTGTISNGAGIKIQLDEDAMLNNCTNGKSSACLCLHTLKLAGGSFTNGVNAYYEEMQRFGGRASMRIFNTLHFSGNTPHAFGFTDGTYPNHIHYSRAKNLSSTDSFISLNSLAPVEFKVDDIDGGDGVDAYLAMSMFTWGTNAVGRYSCDIEKTGEGTLAIPHNYYLGPGDNIFRGNLTVKEGTLSFPGAYQGYFPSGGIWDQTITVSTNAVLSLACRNFVDGTIANRPRVDIVVDHGTLSFRPGENSDRKGALRARNWTFDDATLDISSAGHNDWIGVLWFTGKVQFKGTRHFAMMPDTSISTTCQSVMVQNGDRTVFDVADMTGDGGTDVTMGFPIWNTTTNSLGAIGVQTDSGFIKTGEGTFSVASTANKVSGVVTVSNGTMRVDGVLTTPSSVEVASGAFLGGTGTVSKVSMEAGAGFAAPVGQKSPLVIQGNFNLPTTGVINLNVKGVAEDRLEGTSLVSATGTLGGAENLDNWIITIDGKPTTRWEAYVLDGVLMAKSHTGMLIFVR